ncbi:MAG: DUF2158 domain-containing protein [Candidatus Korobacteraceae bacterium]
MNGGFEVGDMVELKSGSPTMTIERFDTIGGQPSAWCTWFVGTQRNDAEFALAALQKLAPPALGASPSNPPGF